MGGTIKGITIEFNGNTTKLQKAINDVRKSGRDLDKELKDIDRSLKFNPTNIDLWRQKQQVLTQKVKQTEKNLDELRNAEKQLEAQGVDKNSTEFRELQREIIKTENQLERAQTELRNLGNIKLRAASEQVKELGTKLESAGQAMTGLSTAAAGVVASMGAMAYNAGTTADDLNTMSKVFGISTKDLQKYSVAADLVDVSTEAIAKSHQKMAKSMASAEGGSKKQAEAFKKLGVEVTNADGSLRDTDEVWQDTIAALGKMESGAERDAIAMQLMGKSATELNPLIEDGGETYKNVAETMEKYNLDFVDQETLDKANQFNDQLDTMKAIGTVAIQQVGAQLAGVLVPVMERVVDVVGRVAQWIGNLDPKVLAVVGTIAAIVAGLAPVLIVLGKLAFAISSIMTLVSTIGPAIAGVVAALGPVVVAIAAVIAVGVLLYKNWDKITAKTKEMVANVTKFIDNMKARIAAQFMAIKTAVTNAWNALKTATTNAWNAIKNAITTPIKTAFDKIKAIIDKVKNFFPIKVGNIFKGIKLPHFSITGKFSLKPPSVPKLDIDWYKTGGIFDSPSLIGVGEAGAEAVVPLDKFWKELKASQGGGVTINVYANEGQSAREIAEEVKRVLIRETKQRRLAW